VQTLSKGAPGAAPRSPDRGRGAAALVGTAQACRAGPETGLQSL